MSNSILSVVDRSVMEDILCATHGDCYEWSLVRVSWRHDGKSGAVFRFEVQGISQVLSWSHEPEERCDTQVDDVAVEVAMLSVLKTTLFRFRRRTKL